MPVIKNCIVCFKQIKLNPSVAAKKPGRGTYCSVPCMAKDYKTRFAGVNGNSYKHGMSKDWAFYKEKQAAKRKEWKKNNPGKVKVNAAKYRAKRRNALKNGNYTEQDVVNKLIEQNNSCYWCLEELFTQFHVDHVIPLAKNGTNCVDNIVVACYWCNQEKNSLLPSEWYNKENCRAKRKEYATGKTCSE